MAENQRSARVGSASWWVQPKDSIGSIRTVRSFMHHSNLIRGLRWQSGAPPDAFVAGHEKDVGVRRDLREVLRDPELAPLLSHDGVITQARYSVSRGER